MSATRTAAESPVEAAEGHIDQVNTDAEKLKVRLHQSDARLLRAIEEALARTRRGTFGLCKVYQQPISKARQVSLALLPMAELIEQSEMAVDGLSSVLEGPVLRT